MENVLVSLLLPLIPPPVLATLDRPGPSKAQDSSPASFYQPVRLLPGVLPEVQRVSRRSPHEMQTAAGTASSQNWNG